MAMRAGHIVLVAGLALVACGDDESGSTTRPPAPAAASVAPTVPATAGDTPPSAESAAIAPAGTDAPVPSSPATAPPGTGASECSVTITGAASAEWTSDASGPQAFVYGGWLTNPAPDDAGAFGLNCFDRDFNIVGFFARPGTEIPMEPAVYELTDPSEPATLVSAEVALILDEGLWEPTGGRLEILEFDEDHIRGSFSFTIRDSFDSTRTADVSGTFTHSR